MDELDSSEFSRNVIVHFRQIFNRQSLEGGRVNEAMNFWRYHLNSENSASTEWSKSPATELIKDARKKFLISYVQPKQGTDAERRWVAKASSEVEQLATEMGKHSLEMTLSETEKAKFNNKPSKYNNIETSVWVDKIASLSRPEDSQSVWAPLCQMQFFVHPVLAFVPTDVAAYKDVQRADNGALTTEETMQQYYNAALNCKTCRKHFINMFQKNKTVDNDTQQNSVNEEEEKNFNPPPLVLTSVWARAWPSSEALASATGMHLFVTEDDAKSLLVTHKIYSALRAICLLRELGNIPSSSWLSSDVIPCYNCSSDISLEATWTEHESRQQSGLFLLRHCLERVQVVGGTKRIEDALKQWREKYSSIDYNFKEYFINRLLFVRDHLTLRGGAFAPCYDPGDKVTTICFLDLIMNIVAVGRYPNPHRMTSVEDFVKQMLDRDDGRMRLTADAVLCGQTVEVPKKGIVIFWNRNLVKERSIDEKEREWTCPGLGFLSREVIENSFEYAMKRPPIDSQNLIHQLKKCYENEAVEMGTVERITGSWDLSENSVLSSKYCIHSKLRRIGKVMSTSEGRHLQHWKGREISSTLGQIFMDGSSHLAGIAMWREIPEEHPCDICGQRFASVIVKNSLRDVGLCSGEALLIRLRCWQ